MLATARKNGTAKKAVEPAKKAEKAIPVPYLDGKIIVPKGDRVVIQVATTSKMTKGGLHLPDTSTAREKGNIGLVLAVGPGMRNKYGDLVKVDITAGETVLFQKFAGDKASEEDQIVIVRVDDVICSLKDPEK